MLDRELLIEVKDLCKSYGDHVVLENLSTNIYRGEVIAIVGPSGCGKFLEFIGASGAWTDYF